MLIRLVGVLLVSLSCLSCSSDDTPILADFPKSFSFDDISTTGMRTYFYTDTIIYQVDNLQDLDSISTFLDNKISSSIANYGANKNEFLISEISFMSPTEATIKYFEGSGNTVSETTTSYILEQNIGSFESPFFFNFKLNEDLSQLLSCYSHIATRKLDTLIIDIDPLLPMIDTFDNEGLKFQLLPTDSDFYEGFCNPTNETIEMELYANERGVKNGNLIIVHRMDLKFRPL